MKAVLTYTVVGNEEKTEETRLFDTEKSTKVCDIENSYSKTMQEIYISKTGVLFAYNIKYGNLEVLDQKKCKEWLGIHEPDRYIEIFGEPEEA